MALANLDQHQVVVQQQRNISGLSLDTLNNMVYKGVSGNECNNVRCNYTSSNSLGTVINNNSLPILSFNIRSMKTNFNNFVTEILNERVTFAVMGLCETKMTNSSERL